jgi:hypothetical protein
MMAIAGSFLFSPQQGPKVGILSCFFLFILLIYLFILFCPIFLSTITFLTIYIFIIYT